MPSSPPKISYKFNKAYPLLTILIAVILASVSPLRKNILASITKTFQATSRNMSTTTATTMETPSSLKITKRPWSERGHADHGWLNSFHTFSFATYFSREHQSFGPLRVINEDRVQRGTGFGTHSHADFLIWSYIVSGELEHRDSMGNVETLRRGDVQFTRAGTGISHSEYNRNKTMDNHFLQIWVKPGKKGYKPLYITRNYSDKEKKDNLVRVVESRQRPSSDASVPEEKQPIPLEADISVDASILSPGKSVVHQIVQDGPRKVYAHVVMSGKTQPKKGSAAIKIGDTVLREGDGAYIEGAAGPDTLSVESVGEVPAEFLLFDMGQ